MYGSERSVMLSLPSIYRHEIKKYLLPAEAEDWSPLRERDAEAEPLTDA